MRWNAVAAVQNSMERNYEIVFNEWGKPNRLPEPFDEAMQKWADSKYGHTHGSTNIDVLHLERMRSLFRGRMEKIQIKYPYTIEEPLGEALARFPLKEFSIRAGENPSHNAKEVDALFRGLGKIESLEKIEIFWVGFGKLTPTQIEPLIRCASLHTLKLDGVTIDKASADALAKLSQLKVLEIRYYSTKEDHEYLQKAVPLATLTNAGIILRPKP
ncbi:MAG: hypothetical protein AAGA58_00855 [Verrucomicrobiota bacterium]